MRTALGLKSHSGWAALVALGLERGAYRVVERRRLALIEDETPEWAGQPYHAADGLPPAEAEARVAGAIAEAQRATLAALRDVRARLEADDCSVFACAVLAPAPLPRWSTADILAVHLRMHQAEGALYPDVLLKAAQELGIASLRVPAKNLRDDAVRTLAVSAGELDRRLAALGKSVGPPWGADQKNAAIAAMLALASVPARTKAHSA